MVAMVGNSGRYGFGEAHQRLRATNTSLLVLVTATHSEIAGSEGGTSSTPVAVGISGTVEEVGQDIRDFYQQGDKVLGYLSSDAMLSTEHQSCSVLLDSEMVCPKPQRLSTDIGARLPLAFIRAAYILIHGLGLGIVEGTDPATSGPQANRREDTIVLSSILVTGGETPAGAMVAKILHQTLPLLKVFLTCEGANECILVSRTLHLVTNLGATYAIDAQAGDLLDHLQASSRQYCGSEGMDTIVDLTGLASQRSELKTLLKGPKLFLDCTSSNVETNRMHLVELRVQAMSALSQLLLKEGVNGIE
ncbi:hypothetical protein LTR66_012011, partial [Elasticomyces elasticus]